MNPSNVVTDIEQITPQLLTHLLQQGGYLAEADGPQERVVSVDVEASSAIASLVYRFNVCYSDAVAPTPPNRLFLKVSKLGSSIEAARKEVEFYDAIAPQMPRTQHTRLVRCFHAAFNPEAGRGHVLMEDLASTHGCPTAPLPPEQSDCEQAVACLAALHGFWRAHPELGKTIGTLPDAALFEANAGYDAAIYERFQQFMGDRLSQKRRRLLERVLSYHVRIERQLTESHKVTLVHGDAHVWNFLYPHAAREESVRILDWQTWELHNGLVDLAYMIAVHWYPERRRELERPLLEGYHKALLEHGVTDYDWDACWNDYRLSVLHHLFLPIRQWNWNLPGFLWWSHLERVLTASENLECEELLERL